MITQLNTPRLTLKRITPSDFQYIFENNTKEEIMQLLGHKSEEDYAKDLMKFEKGSTTYDRSFENFLMIDTRSGLVIGHCGFHNWYMSHRRAELGYGATNDDYKGKGFMSEALEAIIDHGFTGLGLHRIEALVGSNNTPSLRLMNKFGFVKEGVLREHYFIDDKYEDSVVFSKLRADHLLDNKH